MASSALLAMAGFVLVLPTPTNARTWHIALSGTGDASTIQDGINAIAS